MNKEDHIKYWRESAHRDLDSAEAIFYSGRYDWSLFVGHLALEKILKAIFVGRNENLPPKTHNLVRLAELSGIELDVDQKIFLDRVNDFNLQTRYPDYKLEFYRICTEDYTKKNLAGIKDFFKWFDSLIK